MEDKWLQLHIQDDIKEIDLFWVLTKFYEKTVRVNLENDAITKIRNSIINVYGKLTEFCKKYNYNFSNLETWLYPNPKDRSSISLIELQKIYAILGLSVKELYSDIKTFQLQSGKEFELKVRKIKLDNHFFYGLGLYLGEGINETKIKSAIGVANTNFEIIKFALNWFSKYFGIDRKHFTLVCEINNNDESALIKSRISKYLDVNQDEIKIRIKPRNKRPCIDLMYNCKLLRLIIEWLKVYSPLILLSDVSSFGKSYLQGLLDGEGDVTKSKYRVRARMYDTYALDIAEIICRKLGMSPKRENPTSLYIEGRDFPKLKAFGPFRFHKQRQTMFNLRIKNLSYLRVENNGLMKLCLESLSRINGFSTARGLAGKLGRVDNYSIRETLKKANELDYTAVIGNGNKHSPMKFMITDKGKLFLDEDKKFTENRIQLLMGNLVKRAESYGS